MTARHALRQDGLVLFLSPGRLLHAHLLFCACVKVGLRTCRAAALTALLHTFIGCRAEGHLVVCVHLSHPLESFVVFFFLTLQGASLSLPINLLQLFQFCS